jgi:hypothetical protein
MDIVESANLKYYGISPIEIEIIYSILSSLFYVNEDTIESSGETSVLEIYFPVPYGQSFFDTLGRQKWPKLKGMLKEMKHRRGSKGLKVTLSFTGNTHNTTEVTFSLTNLENYAFEMAIEKLEYMVDIILSQIKNSQNLEKVFYTYDQTSSKWIASKTKF